MECFQETHFYFVKLLIIYLSAPLHPPEALPSLLFVLVHFTQAYDRSQLRLIHHFADQPPSSETLFPSLRDLVLSIF